MQKPIDSLKLSSQDWSKLQQSLTKEARQPEVERRVDGIRVSLGDGLLALLRIVSAGQDGPHFRIRCHNISKGGVGFIHGHFIHPGTPVQIVFVTQDRQGVIVDGVVVRGRLVGKHIHELGVKFDEYLDLDEVINMGLAMPPTEQDLELQRIVDEAAAVRVAATAKTDDESSLESSPAHETAANGAGAADQADEATAPVGTVEQSTASPDKPDETSASAA